MKREKLKSILEEFYHSRATVNHILRGIRRPNYENILAINKKYKVPFEVWTDIKSYLQENDTKQKSK